MIDQPQLVHTQTQLTAVIHLTIPRSEIQHVMGPGIQELMSVTRAQGIGPAGPWFTHHLKVAPATFDFEICVPVTARVTASGRVQASEVPAMKVARTVYHGGYEGLGAAWPKFNAWLTDHGHSYRDDFFECYVAGPESSEDPAAWRTELSRPLMG
jgi:effector-binding domain-containing protein